MPKGQRSKKEAKKPKKAPAPAKPVVPGRSTSMAGAAAPPLFGQ